jgi:hypothetical protein
MRLHLVTDESTFTEQAEDSLYVQALMVALVGAARPGVMDPPLRNKLGDFAMEFGAALRLEPGMTDPVLHGAIRVIAEIAVKDALAVMKRRVS